MSQSAAAVVWIILALMAGIIVGLVAAILVAREGGKISTVFFSGGAAFGATVSLAITIENSLHLLE